MKRLIPNKIVFLIYLSIISGIFIGSIYFYQKWQQNNKIIIKPPESKKTKPISKIDFNPIDPKIPKPNYYIPNIQGTLTYNHSLKIAQKYYNKGGYEKAIVWSYRANQINPNDIKSWKIYTASLAKLGKEKEANRLMQKAQDYFKKSKK